MITVTSEEKVAYNIKTDSHDIPVRDVLNEVIRIVDQQPLLKIKYINISLGEDRQPDWWVSGDWKESFTEATVEFEEQK